MNMRFGVDFPLKNARIFSEKTVVDYIGSEQLGD